MKRTVNQVVMGTATQDGAGVKLTRVLSRPNVYAFDPFLMLDAFDSKDPNDYIKGFPWHPHRGIETVTYLISGRIEHQDSLGNKGEIVDGSCQWMTAGSGILHQEMPKASSQMLGVQLWLNISRKNKMMDPAYHDIKGDMIPTIDEPTGQVRVLSGSYKGQQAVMQGEDVLMTFFDVNLHAHQTWNYATPEDETIFLYVILGDIIIDKLNYPNKRAILLTKGNELEVTSGEKGARFLLFQALPLQEPIAWGGPIVMNTKQELEFAFYELEKGTFIKTK